jgi:hypothetical protein
MVGSGDGCGFSCQLSSQRYFRPDFSFILFDLSKYSDDQIKGAVLSKVGVLLFKHVFTPGYEEKLPEILGLLKALLEKQTGLQYIETIIRYICRKYSQVKLAAGHPAKDLDTGFQWYDVVKPGGMKIFASIKATYE